LIVNIYSYIYLINIKVLYKYIISKFIKMADRLAKIFGTEEDK
jgi:hypothetical protein